MLINKFYKRIFGRYLYVILKKDDIIVRHLFYYITEDKMSLLQRRRMNARLISPT